MNKLTPVEKRGDVWVKRDDLFEIAGVKGGKARTCWYLCTAGETPIGLCTAGSTSSPQVNIVSHIAKKLNIPCRLHIPLSKEVGDEVRQAEEIGGELVKHKAGYNTVIVARSREDAKLKNFRDIPFGMECPEAITQTRKQVENLPFDSIKRLIITVGSGMSLAGVLWGLKDFNKLGNFPIIGVVVGADPKKRLNKWAPENWEEYVQLIPAETDYKKTCQTDWNGIKLDPHYESKCIPFIKSNDAVWIVGCRNT